MLKWISHWLDSFASPSIDDEVAAIQKSIKRGVPHRRQRMTIQEAMAADRAACEGDMRAAFDQLHAVLGKK